MSHALQTFMSDGVKLVFTLLKVGIYKANKYANISLVPRLEFIVHFYLSTVVMCTSICACVTVYLHPITILFVLPTNG